MFGISAAAVVGGIATGVGTSLIMGEINGGKGGGAPASGGGAAPASGAPTLSPTQLAFLLGNYKKALETSGSADEAAKSAAIFLRDTVGTSSDAAASIAGGISEMYNRSIQPGGGYTPAAGVPVERNTSIPTMPYQPIYNAPVVAQPAPQTAVFIGEDQKARVIAEANRLAAEQGISPERALYNYAQANGISNTGVDTMMGFAPGSTDKWVGQEGAKDPTAAMNRPSAQGHSWAPSSSAAPAPQGNSNPARNIATPETGNVIGDTRGDRGVQPSTQGVKGSYIDAAKASDLTGDFRKITAGDNADSGAQLARAIAASGKEVPIQNYNTNGVSDRADQKFSRMAGGIDRANAIAASQGFAQALRGGLADSSQAATVSNNITREFSDKYAALSEQADSSALAENQSNYKSYLDGKGLQVDQNAKNASSNNALFATTAQKTASSQGNLASVGSAASDRLVSALRYQDDANLARTKLDDDFSINSDKLAIDDQSVRNKFYVDNQSLNDNFTINRGNLALNTTKVNNDYAISNRNADNNMANTLMGGYTNLSASTLRGADGLYRTAADTASVASKTLGDARAGLADSSWGKAGVGLVDSATGALTGAISKGVSGVIKGGIDKLTQPNLDTLGVDPDNAYDAPGRDAADQEALDWAMQDWGAGTASVSDSFDWGDYSSDSYASSDSSSSEWLDW